MSDKFLCSWKQAAFNCLTVSHKLQMTTFKVAKAQDRLCMHITFNKKKIARPEKEEGQLLQNLPVCILLNKAQELRNNILSFFLSSGPKKAF